MAQGFLHGHGLVLGPRGFGGMPVVTKVLKMMAVAWEPASHSILLGRPICDRLISWLSLRHTPYNIPSCNCRTRIDAAFVHEPW
jgi:hypothetical protein